MRKMKLDDFESNKFLQNAAEYEQLDGEAKAALAERHAELVAKEYPFSGSDGKSNKICLIILFLIFSEHVSSDYSDSEGEGKK